MAPISYTPVGESCKCHCHNDHQGMNGENGVARCKCLPSCSHCRMIVVDDIKEDKHTHYWEFEHTQWQYPTGLTGSAAPIEYAFLMCRGCGVVKKTKVT